MKNIKQIHPNLLLAILLIVTAVMRLYSITAVSIAGDEPFSIFYSQLNISGIITELIKGNNPPLYEIFLHFWIKFFGIGPLSVRLPSAIFSILTAGVLFKIGQKFFSNKIGFVAGLLFAFSNYQTQFAHEARVYALFAFLTSVSMYYFISIVHDPRKLKAGIALIITDLLIIYSHYLGFFVLFAQFAACFLIPEIRQKLWKRFSIYLIIVLLGYTPIVWVFIERFYFSAKQGTWVAPVNNLVDLHYIIGMIMNKTTVNYTVFFLSFWLVLQKYFKEYFQNTYLKKVLIFLSIFFLLFAISIKEQLEYYRKFTMVMVPMVLYLLFILSMLWLVIRNKKVSTSIKIILVWLLLPLLTMYISSKWVPMFIDRYVLFTTIGFYILAAIAADMIDENFNYLFSILIVALMFFSSNPYFDNTRDVNPMVAKVKEIKTVSEPVFICPDYFDINFTYYYNRDYFKLANDTTNKTEMLKNLAKENVYPINSEFQIDTLLLKRSDKVIYIDAAAEFCYPGNHILDKFNSYFSDFNTYKYPAIFTIYEFYNSKR